MQALPGAEKGRWTPRLHVDRSGLERAGDLRNRELQPSVQRVFQERDVAALHLHGPDSELPPFHAPNGIFRTIDNIRRGITNWQFWPVFKLWLEIDKHPVFNKLVFITRYN